MEVVFIYIVQQNKKYKSQTIDILNIPKTQNSKAELLVCLKKEGEMYCLRRVTLFAQAEKVVFSSRLAGFQQS